MVTDEVLCVRSQLSRVGWDHPHGSHYLMEHLTLLRYHECGCIMVSGSMHGCVSCLTRREPELFKVVSAEVHQRVVEAIEAHIDTVMPRDGSTVDMTTITNSCVDLWKIIHPEGLRR